MAVIKSGYLLEYLSPRRGEGPALLLKSDNATGADNQQERPKEVLRNPQRLYAGLSGRGEMIQSDLHGDMKLTQCLR